MKDDDRTLGVAINAGDILDRIRRLFPADGKKSVMLESQMLFELIEIAIRDMVEKEWEAISEESEKEYQDYMDMFLGKDRWLH